jgi:hypothetical protein
VVLHTRKQGNVTVVLGDIMTVNEASTFTAVETLRFVGFGNELGDLVEAN